MPKKKYGRFLRLVIVVTYFSLPVQKRTFLILKQSNRIKLIYYFRWLQVAIFLIKYFSGINLLLFGCYFLQKIAT